MEKLRRAKKGKKLMGVCAGLARSLGIDVSYILFVWLSLMIFPPFNHFFVGITYVILALVIPQEDEDDKYEGEDEDETK